jgi:hypothetical protein
MKTLRLMALAAVLLLPVATQAQVYKFEVSLDGGQEFPGPGDPDGTGFATLYIDAAANSIVWDITVADIVLPISADHIHMANAGVSGPVRIDFHALLSGGPEFDGDLAAVLANPTGWYVNVHNSVYPAGAIRGQLGQGVLVPEASTVTAGLAVGGLGLVGWLRQRRRQRAQA